MSDDQTPVPPSPSGVEPRRRSMAPIVATVTVLVIGLLAFILVRGWGNSATPAASPPVTLTPSASVVGPSPVVGPSMPSPPVSLSSTTAGTPVSRPTASGSVVSMTLPIYYVDEVSGVSGPRLYREFRTVTTLAADKIATAVQAMISLPPLDADYATLWPGGTLVSSVTIVATVATVDVTAFPSSLGAAYEGMAVSQLVYTVTATEPSITGVKVRVNGAVPRSGHLDLSGVQKRGNALNELANVWILTPTQGLSTGSPVTVKVYGTGFEGNVPLKVFQGATEVASTHVTTMMGGYAEAQTSIALPPGTYELRAYNDNGMDASLQIWDSKTFTVS